MQIPRVDILVEGSCRADPEDSERKILEKLKDDSYQEEGVTGGPSVVCVTVPPTHGRGFRLIYDSGDTCDRGRLENSFKEIEYSPEDIDYVLAGHTHPDHLANNDIFPRAEWYFPVGDEEFYDNLRGEGNISEFYEEFTDREITYEKFIRFDPKGMQNLQFPYYITVMDTDGHQKGHLSLCIDEGTEEGIETRNIESDDLYRPERAILAGDAIIDQRYAQRFLKGDFENCVYNASTYEGEEKDIQKGKEVGSIARLLDKAREKEETIIVPGHGEEFSFEELRDKR